MAKRAFAGSESSWPTDTLAAPALLALFSSGRRTIYLKLPSLGSASPAQVRRNAKGALFGSSVRLMSTASVRRVVIPFRRTQNITTNANGSATQVSSREAIVASLATCSPSRFACLDISSPVCQRASQGVCPAPTHSLRMLNGLAPDQLTFHMPARGGACLAFGTIVVRKHARSVPATSPRMPILSPQKVTVRCACPPLPPPGILLFQNLGDLFDHPRN